MTVNGNDDASATPDRAAIFNEIEAKFPARLRHLIARAADGNAAAFARIAGVSDPTLRGHLRGHEAGLSSLLRYAAAGGVSVEWLAAGDAPAGAAPPASAPGAAILLIPLFEAELAAGAGRVPWPEAAPDHLRLEERVLREVFRARGPVIALRVAGDSMEPSIRDGALALLETGTTRIDRDGQVYALRVDDALLIKRAWLLPGIGIRLRGDNPASPEVTLAPAEAERLQVLGRVVGVLNRP